MRAVRTSQRRGDDHRGLAQSGRIGVGQRLADPLPGARPAAQHVVVVGEVVVGQATSVRWRGWQDLEFPGHLVAEVSDPPAAERRTIAAGTDPVPARCP